MPAALYGGVSRHYLKLRQTAWYIRHSKENDVSKFDYRDPGTDPRYCDGISGEWCKVCGYYVDNCICPALEPDELEPLVCEHGVGYPLPDDYPVCRFCGQPLPAGSLPSTVSLDYYCDALCEQRA